MTDLIKHDEVELSASEGLVSLRNVESVINDIYSLEKEIDSRVFSSADDRKSLAAKRAEANKFFAAFKKSVNEYKNALLKDVDQDVLRVSEAINSLSSTIKLKIEEIDSSFRASRYSFIEKSFNQANVYRDYSIICDQIMLASWLNRSTSEKEILSQIESHLSSLDYLVLQNYEVEEAVSILADHAWDLGLALASLRVTDAEIIEESDIVNKSSLVEITLEIPLEDVAKLEHIATSQGWSIKKKRMINE